MCVLSSSLQDTGLERKPIVVHMCECVANILFSYQLNLIYLCVCLSVVMFSFEQIVSILYKSCLILLFFFVLPLLFCWCFAQKETRFFQRHVERSDGQTDIKSKSAYILIHTFFEFKDPYIYCRISNWQNETRQNTTNIFKILFLVDCVSLQVHDFIQRISFAWEGQEKYPK